MSGYPQQRRIYHSHLHYPPVPTYGSHEMGSRRNHVLHLHTPSGMEYRTEGYPSQSSLPSTLRYDPGYFSLPLRMPVQGGRSAGARRHGDRYERATVRVMDPFLEDSTSDKAETDDFDEDCVNFTAGWWKQWPGITARQVKEVNKWVKEHPLQQFDSFASKNLNAGQRFPYDDPMSCVRDLSKNLSDHMEAAGRAQPFDVGGTLRERETARTAEAGHSQARAEGSASAAASSSGASAAALSPESKASTLSAGSDEATSPQEE